jgi:hypothetical protein
MGIKKRNFLISKKLEDSITPIENGWNFTKNLKTEKFRAFTHNNTCAGLGAIGMTNSKFIQKI